MCTVLSRRFIMIVVSANRPGGTLVLSESRHDAARQAYLVPPLSGEPLYRLSDVSNAAFKRVYRDRMSDPDFVGSIPEIYDRCLGPLLFRPYAEDLATRVAALPVQ